MRRDERGAQRRDGRSIWQGRSLEAWEKTPAAQRHEATNKGDNMKILLSAAVAAMLVFSAVADAAGSPRERQVALTIESSSLARALDKWAEQTGFQIFVQDWEATKGMTVPRLKGKFTAEAALEQLLQGTPLTYTWISDKAVSIRRKALPPVPSALQRSDAEGQQPPVPLAKNGGNASRASAGPSRQSGSVEEIFVTGTHISLGAPSASPVFAFSRDEIDGAGLGSVAALIQRLPQNFNGGATEGTIGTVAGGGRVDNAAEGTGVNLRALNNDATLVLLNGRRLALGNKFGNFVDISLVPLSALERVEVMTDGASAIYGADAVAGVVNFVLTDDFEGAETRLRYGSVTEGDSDELQIGQSFGHSWGSGSALMSYEYYDRSQLQAADRSFTSNAPRPFTLLPDQEKHGVFLNLNQDIGAQTQLFAEGLYAKRRALSDTATPFFAQHSIADIEGYTATIGSKTRLADEHQLEISVSDSANHTNTRLENLLAGSARLVETTTGTDVWSFDGKLDGPLLSVPGGVVRYAVGAQYRDESYSFRDLVFGQRFEPARGIWAGFLEFRVPLVAASTAGGTSELELTLAARTEHYDDFGSSTNPKLGLVWQPTESIRLRATYGTSFKAPLLNDLNPAPSQVVAFPEFDPRTGSFTNVLIPFGGNPALGPEEATTWTAGFDFHPSRLPGLRLSATYYDIDFDDRIAAAPTGVILDALRVEAALGPSIVRRGPSLSEVQSLVASAQQFLDATGTPGGVNLATISAIVDSRVLNLSSVQTTGVDLGLSYRYQAGPAAIELGMDGTYVFEFDNKATSSAPTIEVLNTPYNPVDLKLRGRAQVQWGSVDLAAYVNYVDSYTDNRNGGAVPIDSWTTVDLVASYTPTAEGWLSDSQLTLSILNASDEDPPRVAVGTSFAPGFGAINYDGANASPLGRFYSIQLSKRWGRRN